MRWCNFFFNYFCGWYQCCALDIFVLMPDSSWHIQSSHDPARVGRQNLWPGVQFSWVISLATVCLVILWYTLFTFLTQWSKVCRLYLCNILPYLSVCVLWDDVPLILSDNYRMLFSASSHKCGWLAEWVMLIQWRSWQEVATDSFLIK